MLKATLAIIISAMPIVWNSSSASPRIEEGTCIGTKVEGTSTTGRFLASECHYGTYIISGLPPEHYGYVCVSENLTNPRDTLLETDLSETSATFLSTTDKDDVIVFICEPRKPQK
jgi:hypothetical protein